MSSPSRPVTRLDKSDVLDGLFGEWDELATLVDGLTDEQWLAQTSLPGWTVRDVLAHIVGTESMLQGVASPDADIDVSTLKHVRNDIGVMNELWVRGLSALAPDELVHKYREVTAARRDQLDAIGAADWNAITATPAGPDTYGRFMRVRTFDCWMHEHDIRDALDLPAVEPTGPPARLALDELTSSMGFVVGKLGGAPDGSRVRLELTGPLRRTINIAVEGKGRVVDEFDAEPTVTITLDGLLFTRLAGGRTRHAGAVKYRGDEAVGERIVENLNFVI
ncbi:maleylpyruvate isomerase family mycothiol-dependent enzyme [Mycolicibacterium sp. XJ870]